MLLDPGCVARRSGREAESERRGIAKTPFHFRAKGAIADDESRTFPFQTPVGLENWVQRQWVQEALAEGGANPDFALCSSLSPLACSFGQNVY
jgi:hypothetical protein